MAKSTNRIEINTDIAVKSVAKRKLFTLENVLAFLSEQNIEVELVSEALKKKGISIILPLSEKKALWQQKRYPPQAKRVLLEAQVIKPEEALDSVMRIIENIISPSLEDNTDVEKLLVNLHDRIKNFLSEQHIIFYRP